MLLLTVGLLPPALLAEKTWGVPPLTAIEIDSVPAEMYAGVRLRACAPRVVAGICSWNVMDCGVAPGADDGAGVGAG